MLRVTELMINDWVCINGSNYQVQDLKKKGVVKLYITTEYGIHELEFNTDYLEEEMQPIPLTKEILERNGFDGEVYLWIDAGDEKTLEYYSFEHRLSLWYEGGKSQELLFKCQCFSVHELQHALKLCGIEKEIVL